MGLMCKIMMQVPSLTMCCCPRLLLRYIHSEMTATEKKERVIFEWLKSLPAHDFTQSFAELAAATAKVNAAKKAAVEGKPAAADGVAKGTGEDRNKRPVR